MNTKGSILKRRIKQMGFTQADFAGACGISLSALKKYITDELPYSISLLETFAEKLDCSTDYLLAKSETPMQELHRLKELTHLSDGALLKLKLIVSDYSCTITGKEYELRKTDAQKALTTISLILEDDELIKLIQKLLYYTKEDTHIRGSSSTALVSSDQPESSILIIGIIERLSVMRFNFVTGDKISDCLRMCHP